MAVPNIFNVNWYLQQNSDIAAAVNAGLIDAQTHFNLYGRFEDRSPSPLFDPASYLESNPDIAEAVSAGLINAYDHFVNFGVNEGRNPTPLFDPQFYLQQNPDVAQAIGNTPAAAVQHFLNWGVNEPRAINPAIHLGAYLQSNPDVAEAARFSLITAFDHFATFGITEPRDLGNGVNLNTFGNDPSFQAALSQGQLLQAITRVQEVAPFLPTFQTPPGWTPPPTLPIPVDFIPPQGTQLVIPSGVIVPEGVVLPDVFDPVPLPPVPGNPGGSGGGVTFDVRVNDHGTVEFLGSAAGEVKLTLGVDGELTFARAGVTASTKLNVADVAEGGIPPVTLSSADFSTVVSGEIILASYLQNGAATLGAVRDDDVPSVTEMVEKIAANGITSINLTDTQFSKDIDGNIDLFNNALADGALTVGVSGGDGATIDASSYTKDMSLIGGAFSDNVSGGKGNDIIRAGYGKDSVTGGEGDDVFVIVGSVAENQYVDSDIPDELNAVVTLDSFSRHEISEAEAGESYDGGEGTDTLHIFGTVDMSGLILTDIENIVVHSDVTFSAAQMGNFASITGDGGSTVRIAEGVHSVDLSGIKMSNIGQLDIGNNVTATMSQDNLDAIQTVSSGFTGAKIKAASDALDFNGKNVFGNAELQKADASSLGALNEATDATDVGQIIDQVNGLIVQVNTQLTGTLETFKQAEVTEADYSLICDVLAGMQGASVIQGREGVQNFMSGGDGADTLIGASGSMNFIYVGKETGAHVTNVARGGAERDFIAGDINNDDLQGGDGNDFISGEDGNDTINGGHGVNFILPGEGQDEVTIAGGTEFIDLSEDDKSRDTIIVDELPDDNSSSYIASFDVASGVDVQDRLMFSESLLKGGNGDKNVVGSGSSNSKFSLNTADFNGFVLVTDQADGNFSDAGAKIASSVSDVSNGDSLVFLVDNGSDTMVFFWEDQDNDATIEAEEVANVLLLQGVADVTQLADNLWVSTPM